jgi:hypothetical protein
MRIAIVALSVATLFATAPVFAQGGKAPNHEMRGKAKTGHPVARDHAAERNMQAAGSKKGYPGAFSYRYPRASGYGYPGASRYAPVTRDITDIVTQGGGGGGGGGY